METSARLKSKSIKRNDVKRPSTWAPRYFLYGVRPYGNENFIFIGVGTRAQVKYYWEEELKLLAADSTRNLALTALIGQKTGRFTIEKLDEFETRLASIAAMENLQHQFKYVTARVCMPGIQ